VRPRNEGEEVNENRSIPTNVLGGRACRTKVGPERSLVEDAIIDNSMFPPPNDDACVPVRRRQKTALLGAVFGTLSTRA